MAIDTQQKRQKIARQLTEQAAFLMDTLYRLDALRRQRDQGGSPLVFQDADFAGVSGLAHLDAATVNACFTAIPTILTAFVNNNFDDIFEAVRA